MFTAAVAVLSKFVGLVGQSNIFSKCPTKNASLLDQMFRPKKKIIELGNSEPAKNGGGHGKTKTNVKKSRFGGGTNSK